MVSADHTFEQGTGFVPKGAGIKVNDQKHAQYKSHNDMQDIVKQQPGHLEYGGGNPFREHEADTRNDEQGHGCGTFLSQRLPCEDRSARRF